MSEKLNFKALGEILEGSPEYGANASAIEYDGINPRYLRITDIDDFGRLIKENAASIPFEKAKPYLLKQDDLVIARTGNTVGKSYIYDEKDGQLAYAGYLVKFKLDKSKAFPKYIFQYLHSPFYYGWVEGMTRTGAQPNINAKEYCTLPIYLPPLPQQRKIARILRTVDGLIGKTEGAIAKYQAIKQGMMHDLFTRGIGPDGRLRPPVAEAPGLYEEIGGMVVPREWEVKEFGEVTLKIADRDHFTPTYVEAGVPIISPKDFGKNDKISFAKCKYITPAAHAHNSKKTDLTTDDLVFTRIGALLGKVCIVEDWMPEFSILHSAAMIRVNPQLVLPKYMLYFIKSDFLQRQIGVEVQSIGVPDLGLDKINEFKIFYPTDLEEQRNIAHRIHQIEDKIDSEETYLHKLHTLKQGLMQDLLTGRVGVQPDEG